MDLIITQSYGSSVPILFQKDGEKTWRLFVEFFTAQISNDNTRRAYMQATKQFLFYLDARGLSLKLADPVLIATYIKSLQKSPFSIKLHLAAICMLYDYLVTGGELPHNPASSVKGLKHIVKEGKTPVLTAQETRHLLDSIDSQNVVGARDKALIAIMVFSFARIGAVTNLKMKDYYHIAKRSFLRLTEKGGQFHEIPVTSEISDLITCHTFRATGITTYLKNGGTIENTQYIAAHESPRTTKLYDRRMEEVSLDEIERIVI